MFDWVELKGHKRSMTMSMIKTSTRTKKITKVIEIFMIKIMIKMTAIITVISKGQSFQNVRLFTVIQVLFSLSMLIQCMNLGQDSLTHLRYLN